MHTYRARALLGAVQALLTGRRLILMDLARSWPGAMRVRAPLKRLDRLLSNRHLWAERESFYVAALGWLIRQPHPILLIDWSDLHADCRWQLLRASIPLHGRAFTVFEMVFPESKKGSPRAERQFLKQLHRVLPAGITPILVTDAGFRAPWLRAVAKLGWYYVGRLRGTTHLRQQLGEWCDHRTLHSSIKGPPRRLIDVEIVRAEPLQLDLVLYRRPRRGRVRLSVRRGTISKEFHSVEAQRREAEPWVLVVSPQLRTLHPKQLVALYGKRMQIEQSFRDLKNERYGCAFAFSLTRDPKRIAILLLLHMLATLLAWLAALSMTACASVHYGGVISARPRRHYSLLRIGWETLRRDGHPDVRQRLIATYRHPPAILLTWLQIPHDLAL
jgi:hypothetical protein